MSASVWATVVIGDDVGSPIYIAPIPENVYMLKKKVKEEASEVLGHCSAFQLLIYRPGTAIPVTEDVEHLNPDEALDRISTTATGGPGPLIVVAPPRPPPEDNILGDGVYDKLTKSVCFFRDKIGDPIGTGFAVSPSEVYSAAHNFGDKSEGSEVICHFGKPNQEIKRRLQIVKVDRAKDYCILDIVQGEVNLPDYLEISTDPLQLGKLCILAAFQIGVHRDLQEDMGSELSVGVSRGAVSRLHGNRFVYESPSFDGDSGGGIILRDGRVVGLHQETVKQAREKIEHSSVDDRKSVRASVDELIRSLCSGSIGLELSAIKRK